MTKMVEIKNFRFTEAGNGLMCLLSTRDLREGFTFLDGKIKEFLKGNLTEKLKQPNLHFGVFGVEDEKEANFDYTFPNSFEDSHINDGITNNYTQWNYKLEFIAPLIKFSRRPLINRRQFRYSLVYTNLHTVPGVNDPEKLALLTKFNADNGKNASIRNSFSKDEELSRQITRDFAEYLGLPVEP